MNDLQELMITGDVDQALKLTRFVKAIKLISALAIAVLYFTNNQWLQEAIVLGIVLALILSLGFFDIFIQKLLEYNTQKLEQRQALNANEANEHFDKLYKKVRQ